MDDALQILNDPFALSEAIKQQYMQVANQHLPQDLLDDPLEYGLEEPPKQTEKRLSPLIDKTERDKLWLNGQSLDSKQVTSALGYLDLK